MTQNHPKASPALAQRATSAAASLPGTELQLSRSTAILTGKILPGLVGKAEVGRSLQHPQVRTRGIGKFDQDVCHMEELKERNTELVGCSKHQGNQGELSGIRAK